jgi:hypothetical protein
VEEPDDGDPDGIGSRRRARRRSHARACLGKARPWDGMRRPCPSSRRARSARSPLDRPAPPRTARPDRRGRDADGARGIAAVPRRRALRSVADSRCRAATTLASIRSSCRHAGHMARWKVTEAHSSGSSSRSV